MVVIAESTRRLVGNLFELDDVGAKRPQGHRSASAARGQHCDRASVEGRFDAFHAAGLTELVGREEELELLLRRWSRAKTGEGQVVLLSGEPGIGKSRLTAALFERVAASHTRACAISARHSTLTARFTRSSVSWNVPPDLRAMKLRTPNSTSSTRCSGRARRRLQMQPSLRRCSHCRTTDAIRHSN